MGDGVPRARAGAAGGAGDSDIHLLFDSTAPLRFRRSPESLHSPGDRKVEGFSLPARQSVLFASPEDTAPFGSMMPPAIQPPMQPSLRPGVISPVDERPTAPPRIRRPCEQPINEPWDDMGLWQWTAEPPSPPARPAVPHAIPAKGAVKPAHLNGLLKALDVSSSRVASLNGDVMSSNLDECLHDDLLDIPDPQRG